MWFGQTLREERERQGVSLEAIAEGTKVSVRNLRALEDGNEAALPSGVFRRGIVQSYVRFLNLEEAPWMERYTASQQPAEQDWTEFAQAVSRSRASTSSQMRRRWWGVLLMLFLLGALGWAAWHFVVKPRVGRPAPVLPATASLKSSATSLNPSLLR